jgi:hypothetical protein
MDQSPQGPQSSSLHPGDKWIILCLVVLLLAGAEFLVRGSIRAVQSATLFNDFLSPYIQANAWTRGLDPYSPETLLRLWPPDAAHFLFLPKEVADGTLIAKRGIPTAYPITALVLLAPLSRLPWHVAYALWLILNLALFAVMLRALVTLAGLSLREPEAILLLAAALALAPFHTGIVTANVSVIVVELAVIAVWAARRHQKVASAVLLALATGLKPQIGLCFVLYYLLRRRWRLVGVTCLLLALMSAVGLLRVQLSHTPWLTNYLNDNQVLLQRGILANFTPINPLRFGLTNLQVVLYPLVHSVGVANDLAASFGIVFLTLWALVVYRRNSDDAEVLNLSAIAVLSLLPIYHRFYDAALLVFPVCWVFASFRTARRLTVLSIVLMLPFLIPGGTILQNWQNSGSIPSTLANRWWWQTFVMPHEIWMLFVLSILLLYEMFTRTPTAASNGKSST